MSVFNRYHKTGMAHMTYFFDRADRIESVFALKKTYLSWRELKFIITPGTSHQYRPFLSKEAENIHWQSLCASGGQGLELEGQFVGIPLITRISYI